jgi:hypothetical protein
MYRILGRTVRPRNIYRDCGVFRFATIDNDTATTIAEGILI